MPCVFPGATCAIPSPWVARQPLALFPLLAHVRESSRPTSSRPQPRVSARVPPPSHTPHAGVMTQHGPAQIQHVLLSSVPQLMPPHHFSTLTCLFLLNIAYFHVVLQHHQLLGVVCPRFAVLEKLPGNRSYIPSAKYPENMEVFNIPRQDKRMLRTFPRGNFAIWNLDSFLCWDGESSEDCFENKHSSLGEQTGRAAPPLVRDPWDSPDIMALLISKTVHLPGLDQIPRGSWLGGLNQAFPGRDLFRCELVQRYAPSLAPSSPVLLFCLHDRQPPPNRRRCSKVGCLPLPRIAPGHGFRGHGEAENKLVS
uniref:Uncharacterized protein n=1 Tax=Branchiostoma floridae TaxID=7739 RepID=C3ZBR1_BRAFL|eukprot:XP_002594287.1 hypothetical protein BRAFLDRAFT_65143 [Branchiostoma floridae]